MELSLGTPLLPNEIIGRNVIVNLDAGCSLEVKSARCEPASGEPRDQGLARERVAVSVRVGRFEDLLQRVIVDARKVE